MNDVPRAFAMAVVGCGIRRKWLSVLDSSKPSTAGATQDHLRVCHACSAPRRSYCAGNPVLLCLRHTQQQASLCFANPCHSLMGVDRVQERGAGAVCTAPQPNCAVCKALDIRALHSGRSVSEMLAGWFRR